jgi:glucose/arabinose dehydrogenase
VRERPFLDLRGQVSRDSEQGLLGLAFHPRYATTGTFFVNYTDRRGDTRVVRYRVSDDPDQADAASATVLLAVDQPYANHNGGHLLFGPDGMLYVPLGDGGAGGDPHRNAQNLGTLLGKLLRIDVDGGDPYAVPPDNPFVSRDGARPEIWAFGLRNPWRIAFDAEGEQLYIADVGQNAWEEIHVAPARSAGLDYGWNLLEGTHCYPRAPCAAEGRLRPVIEYPHDEGCSVTGGHVYRGRKAPRLTGHYVFADYCSGFVRSFHYRDGRVEAYRQWRIKRPGSVSSFGEDGAGELYLCTIEGTVYRIEAATDRDR